MLSLRLVVDGMYVCTTVLVADSTYNSLCVVFPTGRLREITDAFPVGPLFVDVLPLVGRCPGRPVGPGGVPDPLGVKPALLPPTSSLVAHLPAPLPLLSSFYGSRSSAAPPFDGSQPQVCSSLLSPFQLLLTDPSVPRLGF